MIEAKRHQSDLQCISTIGTCDDVSIIEIATKIGFKGLHFRPMDKGATFDAGNDAGVQFSFESAILRLHIDHLYVLHRRLFGPDDFPTDTRVIKT